MKNFTLLLLFSLFGLNASMAQNLELYHFPDTVWYNPAIPYDMHGVVENNGSLTVPTLVIRAKNELATGHTTQFCFGPQCFDDLTDSTTFPFDIKSGYRDSTFKLTLNPNGNTGTTTVTMLFYNSNDRFDSASYTTVFINDPAAGIDKEDLAAGFQLDNPAPNPASDLTTISYQLPQGAASARLEVVSLQGKVLQSQSLSTAKGDAQFNVSTLSGGLYLVRLIADDRMIGAVRLLVK